MTEWISVKERLPEKQGRYLCCYNFQFGGGEYIAIQNFAPNLEEVDEYDFCGDREAGFFDSSEYGYFRRDGVTYWMPLPELPA